MTHCKNCNVSTCIKNGIVRGKQRYQCKSCGYNFVLGDGRIVHSLALKKSLCIILYSLGKASFGFMAKLFGVSRTTTYTWIKQMASEVEYPIIADKIKAIEFDEMWHFVHAKKNKKWIIKALDRGSRRTIAWVIGGRDAATFKKLYNKVKHLKDVIFYTDDWDTFASVLPSKQHVIGKPIERDNSNTRHHLGRMTGRTKVVSKKDDMIDASMKLWCALTLPEVFQKHQEIFLSIYR